MKICCLSDLHGYLPTIPECDLLLLGGDYLPTKGRYHDVRLAELWYKDVFGEWINDLSKRMHIVGIAGNHDKLFQRYPLKKPNINWTYLEDELTEFNGLRIWGTPWQPTFFDWAFNLDEIDLALKWSLIPTCDIILIHGPPRGYGDFSNYGKVNTGSPSLTAKILEIKPKLVVTGHIHESYGVYHLDSIPVMNASLVNEKYKPVNKPIMVEL